jgi:hypothetical protein
VVKITSDANRPIGWRLRRLSERHFIASERALTLAKLRRFVHSALPADPIVFSPLDLRVYVRLALVIWCWKLASLDFTALTYLAGRDPFYIHTLSGVQHLTILVQRGLLSYPHAPLAIQLVGIVACLFAAWRPGRISIAIAVLVVSLLEFPAYLWRYQNWDMELSLAVLLLVLVTPCSLKRALSTSRDPVFESTLVGWTLAVYMAGLYFLAGLSKPLFAIDWPSAVQLGNVWRTQSLDIAPYGPISAFFGEWASWLFLTVPSFAWIVGFIVMLDQIFMPLALVDRHFRAIGPAIVFANHLGIAIALGVFFSSMSVLGPAIFVRWSRLSGKTPARPAVADFRCDHKAWALFAIAVSTAIFLVFFPGLTHTVYHPFADNFIFGWSYPAASTYTEVFAAGYLDEQSHTYKPIPRGIGGFMENRWNVIMEFAAITEVRNAADPATNPTFQTLLCSIRPRDSNRFLLGPLALPEHRWSQHDEFSLDDHSTLYLIRGAPVEEDLADFYRPVGVAWTAVTAFPRPKCD